MTHDELADHLSKLEYDNRYIVEEVLKEGPYEKTERVYFLDGKGLRKGPYIRKYITQGAGLGQAYSLIRDARREGKTFEHIPVVLDCYQIADDLVVIMEYVVGETLQEVLYRCDPSVDLAIDIFPRICDGVIELHEAFSRPLIHRDLKPSNIMVTHDRLLLIDFGIARSHKEGMLDDTRHFGTKSYAPPEQFGFGQTDWRSDVYSLGMLLYYCLTEKTPKSSIRDTGFKDQAIPESLRLVLVKATSLDPLHRYQSVRELKDAFLVCADATQKKKITQKGLSENERPKTILEKIPRPLGIVWNVVLTLVYLLFLVGAFVGAVDPSPETSAYNSPLFLRILQNFSVVILLLGPIYFLLLDKRLLSFLPKMSLKKRLLISVIVIVAGILIIGISGQFS